MIIIKADTKLNTIFTRLIKTTKENVEWGGIFVVAGGNLILLGRVKSLFFNFDTKNIHSNMIDIVINEDKAEQTEGNDVLANVLNISMYAFGKWGKIAGLKVEKDYNQLNNLFQGILKEVSVTAELRDDGLKFLKNGIQVAFEEVVQGAVDWAKQGTIEEEQKAAESVRKEEYEVGLWHNLRWDKVTEHVRKSYMNEEDRDKSRFGRNFYMVDYCCPSCGEKLYMVVFPVHKELLIETVEGRVFLARAYTCNSCGSYYTPTPGKLLAEGTLYCFHFDEDRKAYEDYADLLGENGDRCSNYKFNEFESQRNPQPKVESLEEVTAKLESLPLQELSELVERIDAGFYPPKEQQKYQGKMEQELVKKEKLAGIYQEREKEEKEIQSLREKAKQKKLCKKKTSNKKESIENQTNQVGIGNQNNRGTVGSVNPTMLTKTMDKTTLEEKIEQGNINTNIPKNLASGMEEESKDRNKESTENSAKNQEAEVEQPEIIQENKDAGKTTTMTQAEREKEWKKKANSCVGKPYSKIQEVIQEIKQSEGDEQAKATLLFPLYEYRKKQGQKEAETYLAKVPENINKKLYDALKEKLGQYEKADILPWLSLLDEKRNAAEHKEIGAFIKQTKSKDREDLLQLHQSLGDQGYTEHNVKPYQENIYKKIYEMDEAAIQKICPEIMDLSFEKGIEVYREIANGVFLPELKTNTLDMIDKRLTKMKTDENGQLVRKLQKEIQKNLSDTTKIHFYDARNIMRGEGDGKEEKLMAKAMDAYGNCKNKYEYPLMIADSSSFHNGKEGIILTPDQIFFKTFMQAGSLNVSEIKEVIENDGRFQKGILLLLKEGSSVKLPAVYKPEERKAFVKILGEYISYLQEKPESRNIAYLAKEKHAVKCCIRCGYTYKGGSTCPKCGSKNNH